jgi:hypothetical protein
VDELRVGVMIVVPLGDDENSHPFWISKVVDLSFHDKKINCIIVHWFHTTTSDSFCGIYKTKVLDCSIKVQGKNEFPKASYILEIKK